MKVSADGLNALAGDKGHQVQPVRTDVGDGTHGATQARFQAPVPVGGKEQPVLQIRTLDDVDIADLAALHQRTSMMG